MPRFIAFLRAINVGGHTVPMARLRQLFEALQLTDVETFIASGNVIFQTAAPDTLALENRLASHLEKELGFAVATFLRTPAELAASAAYAARLPAAPAINIAFLATPLTAAAREKLLAWPTTIDEFHLHGREVYWRCRTRQSDSKFSNAVLEKLLGQPSTLRGMNTVQRMAARYALP